MPINARNTIERFRALLDYPLPLMKQNIHIIKKVRLLCFYTFTKTCPGKLFWPYA
jgi:hypothetical protein